MSGLLLLNKPEGITSFGAVARIKRLSGEKRVGHTGTLDPMATGVLPVFIGTATSLSSYLLDAEKEYIAEIKLGITTDTLDREGKILCEKKVAVSNEDVLKTLSGFIGKQLQTPPMYSALKKDGVRLYDLARKGIEVDIPKREIEVYSVEQLSPLNKDNKFSVKFCVSKGTYIRSLCRDIGEKLGTGATLTALSRTRASQFKIEDTVPLDSLSEKNIGDYIKNEEIALMHLREINVTEKQGVRFCNGGQLSFERLPKLDFSENELFRIKSGGEFLGVGYADCEKEQIAIKCVIRR